MSKALEGKRGCASSHNSLKLDDIEWFISSIQDLSEVYETWPYPPQKVNVKRHPTRVIGIELYVSLRHSACADMM